MKARSHRMLSSLVIALGWALAPATAFAVDGVIEINQVAALAGDRGR